MSDLPQRVLVLGLARSGRAAVNALERRGVEVVTADRELGNDAELALLDGVAGARQEPGCPARGAARRGGRAAGRADLERGRARLPAARQPDPRRHRDEREDDHLRAPRRDAGRTRGGERRPGADRARRPGRAGRMDRLRAVELPAGGRARARVRDRGAAEPRAGPPRPPRLVRGLPRREAAHLRAGEDEDRPARARARRDRVLGGRPAPGRAAHPRRPQPRERRRRDRGCPRGRRARRADRRGAAHVPRSPAPARARARAERRHATSTTRRRPTSPPRCERSPPTRTSPCT